MFLNIYGPFGLDKSSAPTHTKQYFIAQAPDSLLYLWTNINQALSCCDRIRLFVLPLYQRTACNKLIVEVSACLLYLCRFAHEAKVDCQSIRGFASLAMGCPVAFSGQDINEVCGATGETEACRQVGCHCLSSSIQDQRQKQEQRLQCTAQN